MAKFLPGPAVGQISGRIGGSIFSHNKGGPYIRNGTIPTVVTSAAAINAKTTLATISQSWAGTTAAQKQAWRMWAAENPVTDRLGAQIQLSGHQAFVGLNSRLVRGSFAAIDQPPLGGPPSSLATLSPTVDLQAATSKLEFTATPLGANDALYVEAAVVNSLGINYVRNLMKCILITAVAEATDTDPLASLTARFGQLAVGQKVVFLVSVLDSLTGLLSGPLKAETVVVDTTP